MSDRRPISAKDGRDNMRRAFKATGCVECKRRYPELDWSDLHIDHIDQHDKPRGGSSLISSSRTCFPQRTGAEVMLAEMLVCQVLCADCHKEKHRNGNGHISESQLALFTGSGAWSYQR